MKCIWKLVNGFLQVNVLWNSVSSIVNLEPIYADATAISWSISKRFAFYCRPFCYAVLLLSSVHEFILKDYRCGRFLLSFKLVNSLMLISLCVSLLWKSSFYLYIFLYFKLRYPSFPDFVKCHFAHCWLNFFCQWQICPKILRVGLANKTVQGCWYGTVMRYLIIFYIPFELVMLLNAISWCKIRLYVGTLCGR